MTTDLTQMQDPLGLLRLGYVQPLLEHRADHWDQGRRQPRVEQVAEETPVALVYNGTPHVVMMATPADLEDFALGFSLTEELIRSPRDLLKTDIVRYSRGIEIQARVAAACEETIAARNRRLTGRTGCGICGAESFDAVLREPHPVTAEVTIRAGAIPTALTALGERQRLNAAAGTLHAAGWAHLDGTVALVREDVGRHNALDKLIGAVLNTGVDVRAGFVVITSRASYEMVQKTTVLGAAALAAISGPTGLALRIAQQTGLTLVGFARGGRHTVYTHPERVA